MKQAILALAVIVGLSTAGIQAHQFQQEQIILTEEVSEEKEFSMDSDFVKKLEKFFNHVFTSGLHL